MATQMIIRLEPELKNKVSKLARREGKNLSELVRELLEKYARECDMSLYIDSLWAEIGQKLSGKKITESDIDKIIKDVRSANG